MDQFESDKNVGRALEEIDAETLINDPHPEIKRARLKMEQEENQAVQKREQQELEARIREEQNL